MSDAIQQSTASSLTWPGWLKAMERNAGERARLRRAPTIDAALAGPEVYTLTQRMDPKHLGYARVAFAAAVLVHVPDHARGDGSFGAAAARAGKLSDTRFRAILAALTETESDSDHRDRALPLLRRAVGMTSGLSVNQLGRDLMNAAFAESDYPAGHPARALAAERRRQVALKWGRDFYSNIRNTEA